MMRVGSYAAHLLRSRAHYKESRDCLMTALRRNFGEISVTGEAAGLHLVWYLPAGVPNAVIVEDLARRARIGVYSFLSGGAYVARASTLTQRGLILGYAAASRKQIEQGIARLSDAIDDAIDDPSADVNSLFVRAGVPPPPQPSLARKPRHLDPSFLRKPALTARRRRRRHLAFGAVRQAGNVMVAVSKIYRYPIKGLSAQPMSHVVLEADKPFPHDRIFALARPGAPIDRDDPKWAKKGLFVMLMLDEDLARVKTALDLDTLLLTVKQGNQQVARRAADRRGTTARKIENFFWQLVPTLARRRRRWCAPRGGHFMDKPDNVISLINLATVRALEAAMGRRDRSVALPRQHLYRRRPAMGGIRLGRQRDPDRRGGVHGRPQERPLRRDQRQSRRPAAATSIFRARCAPRSATRISASISSSAKAARSRSATQVFVPALGAGTAGTGRRAGAGRTAARRFMCRGCYFIYEEANGLPQQAIEAGTAFADIPANWRCPDCGTDKTTFRPYVEKAAAN